MMDKEVIRTPNGIAQKIRDYCRAHPELKKDQYANCNGLDGHCYAATEAFFHLHGGYEGDYSVKRISENNGTHWYLEHDDGWILDIIDENDGPNRNYNESTGAGFLTKGPSKRARKIIEGINESVNQ